MIGVLSSIDDKLARMHTLRQHFSSLRYRLQLSKFVSGEVLPT